MNLQDKKRTNTFLLGGSGAIFLLHALGLLLPIVLGLALVGGILGGAGLLCRKPAINQKIRRLFNWIQRRVLGDENH